MGDITTTRTSVSSNTTDIKFTREVTLRWVHVTYTSDANAGNRQISLSLTDGTNAYWDTHAGAVQAASNVYHYHFLPGIYRETSFTDSEIEVPIAIESVIPAGFHLVFVDETGVSGSDSFIISYQTETR